LTMAASSRSSCLALRTGSNLRRSETAPEAREYRRSSPMATQLVARKLQAGLDALSDCAQTCEACAQLCLNDSSMLDCARTCLDCATVCQACVVLLARESRFYPAFCRICADICDACAKECEKFDVDHCRVCAEACRRCAQECRRLAA
jgi:hypothetical protein